MDDWVLCRLYNKKNNPNEIIIVPEDNNNNQHLHPESPLQKETSCSNNSDSFDSFEYSEGEFGGNFESLTKAENSSEQSNTGLVEDLMKKENVDDCGNEWLDSLSLEDLQHCLEDLPPDHEFYDMPMIYNSNQQYFFN